MPKIKTNVKSDTLRARLDPQLKAAAEAILDEVGLNASETIRIFYKQVILGKGLPFDVKIPNGTTRKALRDADADADAGKTQARHGSVDELFYDLGH